MSGCGWGRERVRQPWVRTCGGGEELKLDDDGGRGGGTPLQGRPASMGSHEPPGGINVSFLVAIKAPVRGGSAWVSRWEGRPNPTKPGGFLVPAAAANAERSFAWGWRRPRFLDFGGGAGDCPPPPGEGARVTRLRRRRAGEVDGIGHRRGTTDGEVPINGRRPPGPCRLKNVQPGAGGRRGVFRAVRAMVGRVGTCRRCTWAVKRGWPAAYCPAARRVLQRGGWTRWTGSAAGSAVQGDCCSLVRQPTS